MRRALQIVFEWVNWVNWGVVVVQLPDCTCKRVVASGSDFVFIASTGFCDHFDLAQSVFEGFNWFTWLGVGDLFG